MAKQKCPICGRSFDPEESTAMPFCSPRCKRIDLLRWLDERYAMPVEREESSDQLPEELPE